ncbi:hypothetical protein L7F22_017974 [Adiantum nelumboides]|nr:hypothetical protein [Adiantum nelumboides]
MADQKQQQQQQQQRPVPWPSNFLHYINLLYPPPPRRPAPLITTSCKFQQTLFQDLTNLVAHSKHDKTKFMAKDYPAGDLDVVDGDVDAGGLSRYVYRIFTYGSLPKHSDFFRHPNGLNCRGTMFLVDTVYGDAQLIALPMQKFFNYGEGAAGAYAPDRVENALRAYLKVDGSLLTSYICPFQHKLKFKSRNMPTYREYEVVERSISEELKAELSKLTSSNVSVDLELTTPDNIVVIEYADYAVHVLKARSTRTGNYIDIRSSEFASQYPTIAAHLVEEIPISQVDVTRTDIEGYVLDMPDGRMVKYKTLSYLSTAAALNALRQRHVDKKTMATSLYKAAADGMLDKVRSLHRLWAAQRQINDFPLTQLLEQLKKVEAFAEETLDRLIQTVE